MRKLQCILLMMFIVIMACGKKKEESSARLEQPKTTVPETRVSFTPEQMDSLLAGARKANPAIESDESCILSAKEIQGILEKVALTPPEPVAANEIALLETSLGLIAITFFTDVAPKHAQSFKHLIKAGFYNGTRFHRIIDDFMIQGGDILTRDSNPDNDGTGGPGYSLEAEFNKIPHDLGILSMARSQDPNSAGSQFFICLSRNGTRSLDGKYTVFGKVVGGLDVVKALGKVAVRRSRHGENSVPVEPVFIKQAYMVTR